VVVSDSPVPVAKIDTACKSNISILKKKITKSWYWHDRVLGLCILF
jgi:hypothetical protein